MLRVTTIKATRGRLAQVAEYYEAQARKAPARDGRGEGPAGYYLDDDEPPGRWWGQGAEAVGLAGEVEPGQLSRMLDARDPVTGGRADRGFGDRSARAFDATFSAPKSVSVLWALCEDPGVRAEVAAAHDAAVTGALGWLEAHGAVTRRGRAGVDQVASRGLTVATFRQHSSRAGDPQIHTHALVWSKVQDPAGAWLALDARFLKFQQRAVGWVYQAGLHAELTARLGVSWGRLAGSDLSEVAGVPAGLRELFSQRSPQVAERLARYLRTWAEEHDGAEPGPELLWRLERLASEHTRPNKGTVPGPDELRAGWAGRAREAGFGPVSVPVLVPDPSRWSFDPEVVVSQAVDRVAGRSSAWLAADLAREIAVLLPPDAVSDAGQVVELVDRLAEQAAARCVELHPGARSGRQPGPDVHVTDRQLSTSSVLAQEARLIAWAEAAVGRPDVAGKPAGRLDRAQASAARAVAGSDRLVLVVGPAGAGKTTALRGAVEQLRAEGRPVLGLAPSGKAADVLAREAGCPAVTLAKLLDPYTAPPPAGTTLILDEAGMASTDHLDRLVGLARQHDWRLACVGDGFQLPAVGRGGMFAYWSDTLPAVHLDEVHRFHEEWEAEASLRLRAGDPDVAEVYAAHRRLLAAHPALLAERVARRHAKLTAAGDAVAVTTASAEVAREINLAVQHHRGHWRTGPGVRLHDSTHAFAGDTITTRNNDRTLADQAGGWVRNRQTWTVAEVGADGSLLVTDPERGAVRLPAGYVSRHVELGWAVTGYGNQGVTVDHAICVIEASTSRACGYVGMTRGRKTNTAVIPDPDGLTDPAETLAGVVRRPANGITAHAVRDRLHGRVVRDPIEDAATRMTARLEQFQQPPAPTRQVTRR